MPKDAPDLGQTGMTDQTAKLDWRDGVPIARDFDDPYFSFDDGLAERGMYFWTATTCPRGSVVICGSANWALAQD